MATIAFTVSHDGEVDLYSFNDTVLARLTLRVGSYIVFGKTVLTNADGDNQNATARLTTMDGETELDRADVRLTSMDGEAMGAQEVSLQAALVLSADSADRIVDIRASTYLGEAIRTRLYAIQVDAIEHV